MNDRELLLQSMEPLTEEEIIYKKYYDLRDDDVARKEYMKQIESYVKQHYLLIFEFPFITYPKVLTEEDLYSHLSISKHSNVNVIRHLRYTPVFHHSHSFFTVLYVLKGHCGHTVDDQDVPMRQGDVFFLPPYVSQTIEVFDESLVLNIHIRKDTFSDYFFKVLRNVNVLSEFFIGSLYSKEPMKGLLFHTNGSEEIRDLYLDLYQETLIDDVYSWHILDNIVPILFSRLLRNYSDQVETVSSNEQNIENKPRLQLLAYINDHYRTASLEEVSEHFHYSISHCSKMVREETGMGFVAFVRKVRMDHATALLRNTRTPIAEIGEMVGYENPETFIRAFKKVFGTSPSAYRRENSVL